MTPLKLAKYAGDDKRLLDSGTLNSCDGRSRQTRSWTSRT
jgi:hypothetical protein